LIEKVGLNTLTQAESEVLTPQQVTFFETFGFLHVRGLFAAEAQQIGEAFDETFASAEPQVLANSDPLHFTDDPRYQQRRRLIIPGFVETNPRLKWLLEDPRLLSIPRGLLGPHFSYRGSDGNLFNCDVFWHPDIYNSPLEEYHVKVYYYLDPLTKDTGSLRVIPGTHDMESHYAANLRENLKNRHKVPEIFGVEGDEIPSHPLEVVPGDILVGNFRTLHGSFHGGANRRLFTLNFRREQATAGEFQAET
jgi:Phytanoyl-CoA dioxygenase (PhyH)